MANEKILITGSSGVLGSALLKVLTNTPYQVIPFPHTIADIRNFHHIKKTLEKVRPQCVIHLAALTDVDYCEKNPTIAYDVNTLATKYLADICNRSDIKMIFVSTGAVFDGKKKSPYDENDNPNPINIYGKSKFLAENEVRRLPNALIIRTGWLIGSFVDDKKFVGLIINQLKLGEKKLNIINGYKGSPTFAHDLAKVMIDMLINDEKGVFHIVNSGVATRIQITQEILKIIKRKDVKIIPVQRSFFSQIAHRPKNESLKSFLLPPQYIDIMPFWSHSLRRYIQDSFRI